MIELIILCFIYSLFYFQSIFFCMSRGFFFFSPSFFTAVPAVYGSSQVRG